MAGRAVEGQLLADYELSISGSPLDASIKQQVLEIRVVDHLRIPDSCLIRIDDPGLQQVDNDQWQVGAEIEIKLKGTSDASGKLSSLFKGFVVAVEPEFGRTSKTLTIRAYDYSYVLHAGRRTEVYTDVTFDDVARKIANRNGLQIEAESSNFTKTYLHQSGETDWQFLWRLAAMIDFEVVVVDRKLFFRKAAQGSEQGPDLEYGKNLLTFRPRITGGQSVEQVEVRSWDMKSPGEMVSVQKPDQPTTKPGMNRDAVVTGMKRVNGTAEKVIVSRYPVETQQEADAVARNLANRSANAFAEAEGVAHGDPKLRAGSKVVLKGVGTRFGGDWIVTTSTHVLKGSKGYETAFAVTGRASRTMVDLVNPAEPFNFAANLVVGKVTNTQDPDRLGRVKVTYPTMGDRQESAWGRLVFPHAGATPDRGFFTMPQIDDEVVLGFEHGDLSRPYVMGSVYNGGSRLKDTSTPGDAEGALGSADGSVQIRSPQSLNLSFDNNANLKAGRNVHIEAGAEITIETSGTLTLKAAQLKLDGQSIDIGGSGLVKVSGAQVQIG